MHIEWYRISYRLCEHAFFFSLASVAFAMKRQRNKICVAFCVRLLFFFAVLTSKFILSVGPYVRCVDTKVSSDALILPQMHGRTRTRNPSTTFPLFHIQYFAHYLITSSIPHHIHGTLAQSLVCSDEHGTSMEVCKAKVNPYIIFYLESISYPQSYKFFLLLLPSIGFCCEYRLINYTHTR